MVETLKFIEKITWNSIFKQWKKREGTREDWQTVAEEKGFDSWEAWRANWIKPLALENREWTRYQIENPLESVPHFKVGPSQSWQKNFPKEQRLEKTFKDLIHTQDYRENRKVRDIMADFPNSTELIGIQLPDQTLMLLEGHHRATALSLMAQDRLPFPKATSLTLALTPFSGNDLKRLEIMLNRGSNQVLGKNKK